MEGSYPIFEKLCEGGDYQQWVQNVNYELEYHLLDIFTSDKAHLHKLGQPLDANQKKGVRSKQKKAGRSKQKNFIFLVYKAAEVICSYVTPAILSRIAEPTAKEPWELWPLLKTLSQPFPLFKLPLVIRFMVYDEAGKDQSQWETSTGREKIPALLKSCPTIRHEATTFLYSQHQFVKTLGWDVGSNYSRRLVSYPDDEDEPDQFWNRDSAEAPMHVLLGDWKRRMMPDKLCVRYLRHLTIDFDIMPMPVDKVRKKPKVELHFKVDVKKPASQILQVTVDLTGAKSQRQEAPLGKEIRARLDRHVKYCNAIAGMMDWKGEVIFFALKTNPKLWMLEWEDLEFQFRWPYLRP